MFIYSYRDHSWKYKILHQFLFLPLEGMYEHSIMMTVPSPEIYTGDPNYRGLLA